MRHKPPVHEFWRFDCALIGTAIDLSSLCMPRLPPFLSHFLYAWMRLWGSMSVSQIGLALCWLLKHFDLPLIEHVRLFHQPFKIALYAPSCALLVYACSLLRDYRKRLQFHHPCHAAEHLPHLGRLSDVEVPCESIPFRLFSFSYFCRPPFEFGPRGSPRCDSVHDPLYLSELHRRRYHLLEDCVVLE